MGALVIGRLVVHLLAILITLVSVGLIASAILSSGWQIMTEPGSGEIHQHGLWLDYNRVRPHVAGTAHTNVNDPNSWQWIFNYKYGESVKGDEVHRAQAYQENTLILFSIAMALALIGLVFSYCAGLKIFLAIVWVILTFLATILSTASLVQFYVAAMLPDNRYAFTDRRIEQVIGYSFWRGVIGTIGLGLALLLAIVSTVFIVISGRHGSGKTERAPFTFKKGNNTQV